MDVIGPLGAYPAQKLGTMPVRERHTRFSTERAWILLKLRDAALIASVTARKRRTVTGIPRTRQRPGRGIHSRARIHAAHQRRARRPLFALVLCTGATVAPAALAEPSGLGFSLELPLLNVTHFDADPRWDNPDGEPFERNLWRVGPAIDERDVGPQVLGLVGITYATSFSARFGGRIGFAPTCWDGGPGGESHTNWQVEPFAGYAFLAGFALRPFAEVGPVLAQTCSGDRLDQGTSTRYGFHASGGLDYRAHDSFSLQLSFRHMATWGQYVYYSNGETGLRWDGTDHRSGAQLGVTFWL